MLRRLVSQLPTDATDVVCSAIVAGAVEAAYGVSYVVPGTASRLNNGRRRFPTNASIHADISFGLVIASLKHPKAPLLDHR